MRNGGRRSREVRLDSRICEDARLVVATYFVGVPPPAQSSSALREIGMTNLKSRCSLALPPPSPSAPADFRAQRSVGRSLACSPELLDRPHCSSPQHDASPTTRVTSDSGTLSLPPPPSHCLDLGAHHSLCPPPSERFNAASIRCARTPLTSSSLSEPVQRSTMSLISKGSLSPGGSDSWI